MLGADVDEGEHEGEDADVDDVIGVVEQILLDMLRDDPKAEDSVPKVAGGHNDRCTGRSHADRRRSHSASSTLEERGRLTRNATSFRMTAEMDRMNRLRARLTTMVMKMIGLTTTSEDNSAMSYCVN